MMPKMDGYEMARRVRANPATRFIPIIIQTSARVAAEDARRGAEVGALGYITDPTDLGLLLARARTLLDFKNYLDSAEEGYFELKRLREMWRRAADRKRAAGQFDVFLCHNSKDKELVKDVAIELE